MWRSSTRVRPEHPDTADDATRVVDAVNRYPGWIVFCPQEAGDTALPYTTDANGHVQRLDQYGKVIKSGYQDYSEIVVFTSAYGQKTPKPRHTPFMAAVDADGVEVDASGRVTAVKSPRGGTDVPPGGMVLQGIGDDAQAEGGAQWLRDHATVGAKLTYTQRATDLGVVEDPTDDVDLPLDPAYPSIDVVNGTHALLRHGRVVAEPGGNVANDPRTAIGADGWGPTPPRELRVGQRRRQRQHRPVGEQEVHRRPDLREARPQGAPPGRRVLRRQQHRPAPFTAEPEPLQEAQHEQQQGSGHADRVIRRHAADRDRRGAGQQQGDDEDGSSSVPVPTWPKSTAPSALATKPTPNVANAASVPASGENVGKNRGPRTSAAAVP